MPGKRVQFDDAAWEAIEAVAHRSGRSFQELAEEAFEDLLKKHLPHRLLRNHEFLRTD